MQSRSMWRLKTNLLRELLAVHAGLEAVAKVDVQQLAGVAVQHEVAGVPISEPQKIANLHMIKSGFTC